MCVCFTWAKSLIIAIPSLSPNQEEWITEYISVESAKEYREWGRQNVYTIWVLIKMAIMGGRTRCEIQNKTVVIDHFFYFSLLEIIWDLILMYKWIKWFWRNRLKQEILYNTFGKRVLFYFFFFVCLLFSLVNEFWIRL